MAANGIVNKSMIPYKLHLAKYDLQKYQRSVGRQYKIMLAMMLWFRYRKCLFKLAPTGFDHEPFHALLTWSSGIQRVAVMKRPGIPVSGHLGDPETNDQQCKRVRINADIPWKMSSKADVLDWAFVVSGRTFFPVPRKPIWQRPESNHGLVAAKRTIDRSASRTL